TDMAPPATANFYPADARNKAFSLMPAGGKAVCFSPFAAFLSARSHFLPGAAVNFFCSGNVNSKLFNC
ncbi:hypothetical protein, partial [Erwinia sp.]|uniref:hypothetical protein n=1 Tax=Erwinia citreus TaxID=558 RepID=UPI0028A1D229